MPTARGLWFVAPRRLEVRSEPLPALGEEQALVRTSYSGISAGTERLAYRGELDPELPVDEAIGALGGTFRYPFRYGYSCVGVVEASRSSVTEGQLVFAFHPHQDLFVTPGAQLVPLGDVAPRAATLFPLVETALQITLDAGPLLGEPVVVFGLGAVGLLTAVMLERAGALPLAVEPCAWRREFAARLGIRAVADEDLEAVLAERASRSGVPVVIEASGHPGALARALPILAHEGTVLVASWYGTKCVTLPLGAEFHRRRLTIPIRSTQVSTIPARLSDRWSHERRRRATVELLGELPLDALATHTFDFEDAADAYEAIDAGPDGLVHAALGYRWGHVPSRHGHRVHRPARDAGRGGSGRRPALPRVPPRRRRRAGPARRPWHGL
jgi:2-desacetyl-2-hydroxyethyl bacteriochlorophyllide A dehydrogenase